MKLAVQVISWLALAATIAPPLLFLAGRTSLDQAKLAMFLATIAWYATAPSWIGRPATEHDPVV
jgi:hypothetical protein